MPCLTNVDNHEAQSPHRTAVYRRKRNRRYGEVSAQAAFGHLGRLSNAVASRISHTFVFDRKDYIDHAASAVEDKMATYMAGVRGQLREMLVVVAQTLPIFVIVAYFSTAEKALVATMAFFSIWTAVSARWEGRSRSGFLVAGRPRGARQRDRYLGHSYQP